MKIEDSTLKVGGRPLKYKIGQLLSKLGKSIMEKNKDIFVTNPVCKIANPFTLIVSFTVDSSEKHQIVLQGDYKKLYKEAEDNTINDLSERELFIIIYENQKLWFKKE